MLSSHLTVVRVDKTGSILSLYLISWCIALQAQIGPSASTGTTIRAQPLPLSGRPQTGTVMPAQTPITGGGANSVDTLNSTIQVQGAYQGSTPNGSVSAQPLALTLQSAIERAIRYNLGSIRRRCIETERRPETRSTCAESTGHQWIGSRERAADQSRGHGTSCLCSHTGLPLSDSRGAV